MKFSDLFCDRDSIAIDSQKEVILGGNNLETNLLELLHRGFVTEKDVETVIKVFRYLRQLK